MNASTLAHHTQILEWYTLYQIQHDQSRMDIKRLSKCSHLSPEKYQSIGNWCLEVNPHFVKSTKKEPPRLCRKCSYTTTVFPSNKFPQNSEQFLPARNKHRLTHKILLSRQSEHKSRSKHETSSIQNKNSELKDHEMATFSDKLVTTDNGSKEKHSTVLLAFQPKLQHKLLTGWTIKRHRCLTGFPAPILPKPQHLDGLKYSGHANDHSLNLHHGTCNQTATGLQTKAVLEDEDSNSTCGTSRGQNVPDKSTACQNQSETQEQSKEEKESSLEFHKEKSITMGNRSNSNNILNVLSEDDCKIAIRYHPLRVTDTRNSMTVLKNRSHTSIPNKDRQEDNSDSNIEYHYSNTPNHLSNGTIISTSPSQMWSSAIASRSGYGKRIYQASNAIEKAFDNLQLNSKYPTIHDQNTDKMHDERSVYNTRFQQLNSKLRQQMYHLVDTKSHQLKLKYDRNKSANSVKTKDAKKEGE